MTDANTDEQPVRRPPGHDEAPPSRTISSIAGRFGRAGKGKAITVAALVGGCGVFLAATWKQDKPAAAEAVEPARQVVTFEAAKSPPPTLANPGPDAPELGGASAGQVPALDPSSGGDAAESQAQARAQAVAAHAAERRAIRGAPIMVFSRTGSGPDDTGPTAGPVVPAIRASSQGGDSELDQLRRGSDIGIARAARLPNRNFLILAGAIIPCILQTAMDTATPGYVSCLIPTDVYSDNGAVVLMEKGTKVLGEYRSGMRQGQRRLFVLWSRAVTPGGVAISLSSPATDALGRAGFDGTVDTAFWERFGGALLLSVVDDAASAAATRNNTGTINSVPSDAAAIALQNSANIPPTLKKPQGSEVAVFVAQDFDFSRVYELRAR